MVFWKVKANDATYYSVSDKMSFNVEKKDWTVKVKNNPNEHINKTEHYRKWFPWNKEWCFWGESDYRVANYHKYSFFVHPGIEKCPQNWEVSWIKHMGCEYNLMKRSIDLLACTVLQVQQVNNFKSKTLE